MCIKQNVDINTPRVAIKWSELIKLNLHKCPLVKEVALYFPFLLLSRREFDRDLAANWPGRIVSPTQPAANVLRR